MPACPNVHLGLRQRASLSRDQHHMLVGRAAEGLEHGGVGQRPRLAGPALQPAARSNAVAQEASSGDIELCDMEPDVHYSEAYPRPSESFSGKPPWLADSANAQGMPHGHAKGVPEDKPNSDFQPDRDCPQDEEACPPPEH